MTDNKSNCLIFNYLPLLIIVITCIIHLKDNTSIKILGDEYGYWAAGSYFSGFDWSELTSVNSYYGYGYGIFLWFILKVTSSQTMAYQIALILNVFFICLIYVLVLKWIDKLTENKNIPGYIKTAIVFVIVSYTPFICYSQFTLPEVLISLLFWMQLYVAFLLLEDITYVRIALFLILNFYSFAVHMRTVGIFFNSILFLFYVLLRKSSKKHWFVSGMIFTSLLYIVYKTKILYQNAYFAGGAGENFATNNLSGQVKKLSYFFSFDGFKDFIITFLGKIYYALSSVHLLIFVAFTAGIVFLAKKTYKKSEETFFSNKNKFLLYYSILSFLFMIGISSISFIDFSDRFDLLMYGRYFEYTLPPLVLFALLYLYEKGSNFNLVIVILNILFYIIITFIVNLFQDYNSATGNVFCNISSIFHILKKNNYSINSLFVVSLSSILIFLFFIFISRISDIKKKNHYFFWLMIVISFEWLGTGLYTYERGCLSWAYESQKEEELFADYITSIGAEDSLYYYWPENCDDADVLQFLLKNHSIHCLENLERFSLLHKNDYLITISNTKEFKYLMENNFIPVYSSSNLKLWSCGNH